MLAALERQRQMGQEHLVGAALAGDHQPLKRIELLLETALLAKTRNDPAMIRRLAPLVVKLAIQPKR